MAWAVVLSVNASLFINNKYRYKYNSVCVAQKVDKNDCVTLLPYVI